MARSTPEWRGRSDDSMPPKSVFDRLYAKQSGRDAITGIPFAPGDRICRDHIIPLIDGGENRESNLQLITEKQHKIKTAREAMERAKTRAVQHKHRAYVGAERPKMRGAGFQKAKPQKSASRKIEKWSLLS